MFASTTPHRPVRRYDWTLAPEADPWSSCRAGDVTPTQWWGWIGPHLLLLKDTRKGKFRNRLLPGGAAFLYELPHAKCKSQDVLHDRLRSEAAAERKGVEVRLFAVECARNYYLGEFVVAGIEVNDDQRTYVRLQRLLHQDADVRRSYEVESRPKRSRSEARHADVLATLLPGWRIVHEPECVSSIDSQLVVEGVMQEWGGDQYVCDYVAAKGSRRVCFESKASDDGFDDASRLKCRALRDQSLTRVVALVDHGPRLRWHDFGCPGGRGDADEEASGTSLDELVGRLLH